MNKEKINLGLTVDETNVILESLSKFPYVQVVELIKNIRDQAEPQINVPDNQQKDTEEKTSENDKGSGEAVRYIEESPKPE